LHIFTAIIYDGGMKTVLLFIWILVAACMPLAGVEELYLRDNLQRAQKGDYIVTAQGKMGTLLHIYGREKDSISIEEISVPLSKIPKQPLTWQGWLNQKAPGNTSWSIYQVDLHSGRIISYFSVTKNGWFRNSQQEQFLSTLLNLPLRAIPSSERRKVGIPRPTALDNRPFWQPKMVVNGHTIPNVSFTAWQGCWPQDNSDLSGKTVEIYLPANLQSYPSYFPYWLQVSTMGARASARIIDAGCGMESPIKEPVRQRNLSGNNFHPSSAL
jgi:hypothetical protein